MKCMGCNNEIPLGQRVQVIDTQLNQGHWMDIYCYLNLDNTRYIICETSSRKANGNEVPF